MWRRLWRPPQGPRLEVRIPRDPNRLAPAAGISPATCYFSTPDRMRRCFPNAAAQIFLCKGELRLEADALTFVTQWQTRLVIPLVAIEDLSVGQFQMWTTPWVMQYERLNFLSVTYNKDGRSETVHLTPCRRQRRRVGNQRTDRGLVRSDSDSGDSAEGFCATRYRTARLDYQRRTGLEQEGLAARCCLADCIRVGRVAVPLRLRFFSEPIGMVVFMITWLLLLTVIWFSVGFLGQTPP